MLTRASIIPAQDETGTANIIAAKAAAMSMVFFIRSSPFRFCCLQTVFCSCGVQAGESIGESLRNC
jgi:hypothetical protein